jgi:hypothetical protein
VQEYVSIGIAMLISILICVAMHFAPGSDEDHVVSIDVYHEVAIYILEQLNQYEEND